MLRRRNNFASGFRLQASGLIFKLVACSLWRVAVCSILFLSVILATCLAQDKIVAIVNDDVITQKDLNDFANFMRVQLSGDYKGKELENKIQSMKLDLLDKLIEDRLILQEAKKSKLEPDQNRVKAKINELKSRYPSSREFEVSLLGQGLTEADIESRLKEQLLTYNIIDLKVKKKIVVNPIEVTDFYQKNIQDFVLPSQREFTYIMVNDIKLAQAISQELKNGQALGDLAKKNNLELDKLVVSQASGQLREDIEEAIFKLKIGEVSHVLAIQGNYYIFMFNSIIPSRQQTLAEVQEDIYQLLFNQKFKEELTQWLDELKKHSYIKIF